MATEQWWCAQVFKISQKDLKFTEANKNKNEDKLKFQGQSARLQRWSDIDFDCIEVNFSTREPDLYKKLFQSHNDTQDKNIFKFFKILIRNSKFVVKFKFHNDAPMLKYCKKSLNSCCFSILESPFSSIRKTKASNSI